jgi:hypothetical protein
MMKRIDMIQLSVQLITNSSIRHPGESRDPLYVSKSMKKQVLSKNLSICSFVFFPMGPGFRRDDDNGGGDFISFFKCKLI